MSKRTRYADNSKRPQPLQQQRAQARLPARGAPAGRDEKTGDSQPPAAPDRGGKR